MKKNIGKKEQRNRRHARIRAKIFGTKDVPRLAVFRSNKYISAQLIDDESGKTLVSAHSREGDVGALIAEKAKARKISKIVFDRGGFMYTGKVRALAEEARKGGLQF